MKPESSSPAELVRLLESDATPELKARSCQQLAITGDATAVPALARLLEDARLGDYARTALENIPAPAAGAALLAALPRLKDLLLAGAVDSLGVRRETAAVPALIALSKDPARGPASGALAALGKIASPPATEAILAALTGPDRNAAGHACLHAARTLGGTAAIKLLQALIDAKPEPIQLDAAHSLLWKLESRPLFNGSSLDGWEGDAAWFRVYDRSIVAGSLARPIPQNEFLVSKDSFSDFELRLQVRLAKGLGNGGIQFRSQRVPGSREMAGYQADLAKDYWGGLYDESRRKTFLGTRCDPAALAAVLRPDGWNDYRILCEGTHIRLWVNGLLTTDFTETDASIPKTGHIGLQIHSGAPSEAWYRAIVVKPLPATR